MFVFVLVYFLIVIHAFLESYVYVIFLSTLLTAHLSLIDTSWNLLRIIFFRSNAQGII